MSLIDAEFEESQEIIRTVFNDLDGFIVAGVLMTVIEIDLLPLLKDVDLTANNIVDRLGLIDEQGKAFLETCGKYGYLIKDGESYSLSSRSKQVLEKYDQFKAYCDSRRTVYKDMMDLSQVIKVGTKGPATSEMWAYQKDDPNINGLSEEVISTYSRNMDASSRFWSKLILDATDLSFFKSLLDVGGSAGGMAGEVAKRYPSMEVGIFDLPHVAQMAKANITENGLDSHIRFYPGNFFEDPLPTSFELATLVRVLWDWPNAEVSRILAAIYTALSPGGKVMICEGLYTGDRISDRERANHAARLLLVGGKVRSALEYSAFLTDAGFEEIVTIDTSMPSFKIVQGSKN